MKNSQKGDFQRDNIARLLRIKHHHVIVEHKLTATTADIYFEDRTNNLFPQKIAVESKNWAKNLTSKNLANIYELYRPSIQNGEIDYLWIIGKNPLSSTPRTTLGGLSKVIYSNFDEFNNSLMNFSQVIDGNIKAFQSHESAPNYIPTRSTKNNIYMDDIVNSWISSDKSGLIIIGGYGTGKTTYSYYLAKRLSEEHILDPSKRIPIRISLSNLYSKQDLVSLICSTLNGEDALLSIPNFSYYTFLELNKLGRLLIILDGFDEMRHAIDFEDFIYIFEQIRILFAGFSKVILLGRPNSFLSFEEEQSMIDALTNQQGASSAQIDKTEIDFLNEKEIFAYINSYIERQKYAINNIKLEKIRNITNSAMKKDINILSRPVQLKMFTSIMNEVPEETNEISRYDLYKSFVYRFVRREDSKLARQPFTLNLEKSDLRSQRTSFMRNMAWWLLTEKKENRFLTSDLPYEIIPDALRKGNSPNSAIREALIGSVIEPMRASNVLDSKQNRYYYFPHKSYIEFLVSEYFCSSFVKDDPQKLAIYGNREIVSFIRERDLWEREIRTYKKVDTNLKYLLQKDYISPIKKLRECLRHVISASDPYILQACLDDTGLSAEISERNTYLTPHEIILHYKYHLAKDIKSNSFLINKLRDTKTSEATFAILCFICHKLGYSNSEFYVSFFCELFYQTFAGRVRSVYSKIDLIVRIFDKYAITSFIFSRFLSLRDGKLFIDLHSLRDYLIYKSKINYFKPINDESRSCGEYLQDITIDLDEIYIELADKYKINTNDFDDIYKSSGDKVGNYSDVLRFLISEHLKSKSPTIYPIVFEGQALNKLRHS